MCVHFKMAMMLSYGQATLLQGVDGYIPNIK